MRKILIYGLFLVIFLNLNVLGLNAAETGDSTIVLEDDNLDKCIRDELGIGNSQLTQNQLLELQSLDCSGQQIKTIKGLEFATNIQTLKLSNNQISDITPLSKIYQLRKLDLANNQIVSIDSLSSLHNLLNLNLDNNQISNIDSLSGYTRIYELSLSGNQISDISPLRSIKYIDTLDLSNNQISDISGLEQTLQTTNNYDFSNQTISLDDDYVVNRSRVTTSIRDLSGNETKLTLGYPAVGTNQFKVSWNQPQYKFSGTVQQKIIYQPMIISSKPVASTDEGANLQDEQLIALFNVNSPLVDSLTVDQSKVNYQKPGEYQVKLSVSDSSGDQSTTTVTLVIEDKFPTIEVSSSSVQIDLGTNKQAILDSLTFSASEYKNNDLTSQVKLDAKKVDYSTPGVYPAKFEVKDDDGNTATKSIRVSVL